MVVRLLFAAAGLLLLTLAADHLVLGSSRLASRIRISPVVVGVVVIGLGTSAPEFLVSGVAAARGDIGIAIGNIVGSNILNLTLILGVAALIGSVSVTSTVIRREVPLSVGAVLLFALLAWSGGLVTGMVLAAGGIGAVLLLLRWARQFKANQELAADAPRTREARAILQGLRGKPLSGTSCRWGSWCYWAIALVGGAPARVRRRMEIGRLGGPAWCGPVWQGRVRHRSGFRSDR
jgi:cation:H+ antiporter